MNELDFSGLDFDDVYLHPQISNVNSRTEVDLSVTFKSLKLDVPFIASPMSGIVGTELISELSDLGGIGILHRFHKSDSAWKLDMSELWDAKCKFGVAIGLNDSDDKIRYALDKGANIILVDIANGYLTDLHDYCKKIEKIVHSYDALLMSGNVVCGSGVNALHKSGCDMVRVGIGCFATGTRILMSNGIYKNIEDVVLGDRIITKNGNSATVKRNIYNGKKKVRRIRTNHFYKSTFVTDNHNYYIANFDKEKVANKGYVHAIDSLEWNAISNVENGLSLFPRNINFEIENTFSVDLRKRTKGNWRTGYTYDVDAVLTPSYDLGYIFGTFMGDGNSAVAEYKGSHIGSINWSFGYSKANAISKLPKCINNVFSKDVSKLDKGNLILYRFYYKPFADFLISFGKKENKHLPYNLLVDNKEYLSGILDGLLDSDGHIEHDGTVRFTNTSVELIELMYILRYMLNNSLPISYKQNLSTGLENMNLDNCNTAYGLKLMKCPERRKYDNYLLVKIMENISEDDELIDVYDLEINDPSHSFIANNSIVHNSGALCTTRWATGVGKPQLQTIMECCNQTFIQPKEDENGRIGWKTLSQKEIIDTAIVADGGLYSSGDMSKALAAGADFLMIGTAFAESIESSNTGTVSGMASEAHQMEHYGSVRSIEGISRNVERTKSLKKIVDSWSWGIRSACTYMNASNLKELKENAQFIRAR